MNSSTRSTPKILPLSAVELSTELEMQFVERAHFIAWAECEMTRRQEAERRLERESTRRGFRFFRGRGAQRPL